MRVSSAMVFSFITVVWVMGCASTNIESRKDPTYTDTISRLLVVANINPATPELFGAELKTWLVKTFEDAGVRVVYQSLSGLELETPDYAGMAAQEDLDALLFLNQTALNVRRGMGGGTTFVFDCRLYESSNFEKPVWRASSKSEGQTTSKYFARSFSENLLKQLRDDGLIR